jgi:hypothetical protein
MVCRPYYKFAFGALESGKMPALSTFILRDSAHAPIVFIQFSPLVKVPADGTPLSGYN